MHIYPILIYLAYLIGIGYKCGIYGGNTYYPFIWFEIFVNIKNVMEKLFALK